MLGGTLAAVLTACAATVLEKHADPLTAPSPLPVSQASRHALNHQQDVPDAPAFLPRAFAEKPFVAGIASNAPSPYLDALTRIYRAPADTAKATKPAKPLHDEIAKFHAVDTGMPIALARITSNYGQRNNPFGKGHVFHRGIDMAAPKGTPVQAVADGTVVKAATDRTYGKFVVINHHNGYRTLYAHNSQLLVKVGDRVKVGHPIAKVGSTGRSTGPHLHFEIHRDGKQVDPYPYLAVL
ncbi:hypothetical protein GCM10027066_23800 [Dyella jejuensis]